MKMCLLSLEQLKSRKSDKAAKLLKFPPHTIRIATYRIQRRPWRTEWEPPWAVSAKSEKKTPTLQPLLNTSRDSPYTISDTSTPVFHYFVVYQYMSKRRYIRQYYA